MGVNVFSSPLFQDMRDIATEPPGYKAYFLYGTTLHTKNEDIDESKRLFISSFKTYSDFVGAMTDYIEIDLYCSLGTYIYDIYPYADDLELTVKVWKQHRLGEETTGYVEERFKAVFLMEKNNSIPTAKGAPRDILDREPPVIITLQLLDRSAMALRAKTTQGAFNNVLSETNVDMTGSSLLKSILSTEASQIKITSDVAIDAVNIEEADNKTPMESIVIPTGTNVLDLANFIQEERGGIYSAGINTYVRRYCKHINHSGAKTIFVYSLFDGEKYHDSSSKLLFYIPTNIIFNDRAKTYSYEGGVFRCITNPIKGLDSTKGNILRSDGDGFRVANARSFMGFPIEVTPEGPIYNGAKLMTEVVDKPQHDGLHNAPYKGISGNYFSEASQVLARKGEYVKLVIDNLDMDYIYPGAPCLISYDSGNGLIQELYGVLHKAGFRLDYAAPDMSAEHTRRKHALVSKATLDIYITSVEAQSNVSPLKSLFKFDY